MHLSTLTDEGSFSNAAERLQLSQSMVTIHIRNLETELGARLLNRTTRTMELSADGKTFYYYAKQMLKLNRDSLFALTRANQDEKSINIVALHQPLLSDQQDRRVPPGASRDELQHHRLLQLRNPQQAARRRV